MCIRDRYQRRVHGEWYLLMNRCILPKVMYHLQTFEVNPRNQNIDLIKNILEWEDYLPFEQIVNLYETQLLQKFGAILNEWLENPQASKEEMRRWLSGWMSLFSSRALEHPIIANHFRRLLDKV
eukprot:TRINITY_DN8010_c0_g1_i1.p1 TRINITY_DN8010_c0_g1~~TRINITY_DN8010_c0_g1_i1.p1  ORF type:complete len:124 (+),score=30.79 TRINITY_DN8010_c0_g1_i1:65-436(+)